MPTSHMGPRSRSAKTGTVDRSWPYGGASQKLLTQQNAVIEKCGKIQLIEHARRRLKSCDHRRPLLNLLCLDHIDVLISEIALLTL